MDGAIIKIGSALNMTPIQLSKRLPLVILERPQREQLAAFSVPDRPFAVIGIDNRKVGTMAADYLSHLGNYASYIFIHDPNDNEWSRLRGSSFKNAMKKQNHSVSILSLDEFERKLPSIETPMAIFTAFDLLSTNVLKICRQANLPIPGDAVVLGVDNDAHLCENTVPTLSSIRLAHENLGFAAAKALNALMDGKKIRENEELSPLDIIVRNSTTCLPPPRLLVDRAQRLIDEHIKDGLHVSDIAQRLGVSPSLLKLRFRQVQNRSPRDTLVASRLGKVCRLLKTTSYPVSNIAKMCGFSSSVVLNHIFNKKFGTSPGKWRKMISPNLSGESQVIHHRAF